MYQSKLEKVIRERIASEGPITFESFMELALYHHDEGYYMTDVFRIGPDGDYYTASHLHPIMGWLLAVQLDEVKRLMGHPDNFTILEIGAGRGYLAEGIIAYLLTELNWKDGWRYIIVEKNQFTVDAQKKCLDRYAGLVAWKSSLDEVAPFCGCVLSNELVDAFPVHLLQMGERPREIYVGINTAGFEEINGDLSTEELTAYIKRYRLPEITGYRTEVNLRLNDFLMRLDRVLSDGVVVTIDYGYCAGEYYAPERYKGTLLSYLKHSISENPLKNVGHQDITAHVNFTSLHDWGQRLGLETIGYCSQGAFLASLGIDELIARQLERDKTFQSDLQKIKGLLFGIGDSHQVIVQYKGDKKIKKLRGFRLNNKINKL